MSPVDPRALWGRVLAASGDRRPVLLIDGGSGAGKTTLARAVAQAGGARLVSLEDFYPGWDGLAAAAAAVVNDVLAPARPGYRRWDWERDRAGEWVALDPGEALVIEGCGAITPRSRTAATYAVWLELDAARRRERALARDGETYAPHWQRWAAQEERHWRDDHPRQLADEIIAVSGATPT